MSDTTRNALARYDESMRDKAAAAGQPVPRTAGGFPGYDPERGYLVFRYDPGKRRLAVQDGSREVTASPEHVSRAFRDPTAGALVLDRKAANAMAGLVAEDDLALTLSVAAHRAAPVSPRYTELAAVCAARFWAPPGMDADSGDAWLAAFGAAPGEARQVAEHAAADGPEDGEFGSLASGLRDLISQTMDELSSALHPGASPHERAWVDRNFAFELCEALAGFTDALFVYDPKTRRRGILAGDLIRADVTEAGAVSVRLRLTSPVSVKQGEEVTVLPVGGNTRPGPGTCCLARYTAEDGSLYADLSGGKGTGLDVARYSGEVLLGNVKPPFLMVPRKAYTRWTGRRLNGSHKPPRKRPVPSYIVLAGGGPDVTGVPAG
jgi:hypothetical protein